MKLYICGKITGDKNYKSKFEAAKKQLEKWGYEVCNPAAEVTANSWETAIFMLLVGRKLKMPVLTQAAHFFRKNE